ncbi:uncharacterized protein [Arachis hypogaea]|uniref:uncharacterized protein n=1 Tax=Arachis hypogaea TaxID=3818 RepID=UPI003B213F94
MGATPFIERILREKLPKGFDKPTDMKYDGTKDPQEHLTAFEARMNLEGAPDAVQCRAFPVTLTRPGIKWFNALPNESITGFHDISRKFKVQFTTRITKAKHLISLLGVTQRQDESTRKYFNRFNDECLTVDGLTDSIASLCLTNGLMNEDFQKHLTTRPMWTMHEIQGIAKEYINDEKTENSPSSPKLSGNQNEQKETDHQREKGATRGRRDKPPRESPETDPTIIVNVITGKDTPSKSKLALKKDLKVLAVKNQTPTATTGKAITSSPEDCQHGTLAEDAPFVISTKIGTGLVRRILVDTGANSNILFRGAFDKFGLRNDNLQTHRKGVTRLGDNFLKPDGSIVLPLTIGMENQRKTILSEFVVLKDSTAYNVILGRKTINDLSAVIFTKFLLMKFTAEDGSIGIIHGDREIAVECDNTSLALRERSRDAAGYS